MGKRLQRAENAADTTVFPAACLADLSLIFLLRGEGGAVEAGALANLSDTVVGMSNVFGAEDVPSPFEEAARAVSACAPGRPVVGYESGEDLDAARKAGFREVGTLRVLVPMIE